MTIKSFSIFILMAFSISLACADEIRQHSFDSSGVRVLDLSNAVGSLTITPSEHDRIDVTLTLETNKKPRWYRNTPDLSKLDLTHRQRGSTLQLSFKEKDVQADWVVNVPASADINIEQGVGTVEITDIHGNLTVKLGVGSINIVSATEQIGTIDATSGVGDTRVTGAGNQTHRRALISSESTAIGSGSSRISAEVGVGDVEIRLE